MCYITRFILKIFALKMATMRTVKEVKVHLQTEKMTERFEEVEIHGNDVMKTQWLKRQTCQPEGLGFEPFTGHGHCPLPQM